MTIRNPTSLVVDFNTDLKTEITHNKFSVNRLITNTLQLPLGGYSTGTMDITSTDGTIVLGSAGTGVILSTNVIDVSLDGNTPVTTKLFAYDGDRVPISISTESTTPITVEYVIGTKKPTVPDAPILVNVVPGNTTAQVFFNVPYYDGGSPIIEYLVVAQPGGASATGTSSPITVTGLTNGTEYAFVVIATNKSGDSLPSNLSSDILIGPQGTVPDAPIYQDISMNGNEVSLYFAPPDNDGGQPITQYVAISEPGGIEGVSTESPVIVSGLNYNTTYTFKIYAENAIGRSLPSVDSPEETPIGFPDAPDITDAVMNNNVATISFTTPNDNGNPITRYVVIIQPGNGIAYGQSSPIDVTNLRGGTEYTFTVLAETDIGNGAQSQPSQPLMAVATVPGLATIDNLIPGTESVDVYFSLQDDGGDNITSYTITEINSNFTYTAYQSPYTVTGLTSGTQYLFGIYASNNVGDGPISTAMGVATN